MQEISHSVRKVLRKEDDQNYEDGMPVESCRQGVTGRPAQAQAEHIGTTAVEPE